MTDLRDAARQALKSLRGYRREIGCEQPCDAERALEAALEQPEQEPVVTKISANGSFLHPAWEEVPVGASLYAHPPRREWRGLTEKEVNALWASHDKTGEQITRAIEAALKERNV
jgi:hypothetical protein